MEVLAPVFALVMYFLPTIIAFYRGHASKWAIFAMNFILGITVFLWLWAFFWSLSNKGQNVLVNINNTNNNGG